MTFSAWLALCAICVMGAVSPGPSLAIVLRHSLNGGQSAGMLAAFFHGVGVAFYAVLAVLGLGALMQSSPVIFNGLIYAGAAYLAYLGIKSLLAGASTINLDQISKSDLYKAAKEGFAIAFLNPKLAIFFIALFSQLMPTQGTTLLQGGIMVATVFAIDTLWYLFVAWVLNRNKSYQWLVSNQLIINKLLGVAFIVLALSVVLRQVWG